jgi:hypothetical protein
MACSVQGRPKMPRQVKSMFIIFFNIKGNVHKEFILARHAVNSAYYCHVLWQLRENVWRLWAELWRQSNWLLHHDNALSHTSFFTREFFTKSNMTLTPHSLYFHFSPVEDFYITEVIVAESLVCWTPSKTQLPGCI